MQKEEKSLSAVILVRVAEAFHNYPLETNLGSQFYCPGFKERNKRDYYLENE